MTGGQHRAEFERLVERRRKFIDGLDANKDEINLDIFEDFYPDKAHFVYELLQNAEDAGATEITFALAPEKLICEHNGRPFTLADVTSITGLHDSTKAKAQDKIGKFGVGFKSVFVYTQAPAIHSGEFAFRIAQLVLPELIEANGATGGRTRFEFPFDNPKKPQEEAYAEIASGLHELDEKTLLFLTNLQGIKWQIDNENSGEVCRARHSDYHVEVVKVIAGKTASGSHFLKFDQPVPGLEQQRVAVAFPLDVLPGVGSFDPQAPLATQLKIIPAEPGSVAVFFPAVKEASGLRFHLHGPFVPELSRASIKETKANTPLFEQLAMLAADSLHRVKELGLLTPEFLAVLPNPQDQVQPRYQAIRAAIIAAMKAQALTPTHSRGHAPADRLLQARASLKELLSETDLAFLVDYKGESPLWAIGATQRNNRIDQFLTGLEIREWGVTKLVETLRKYVRDEAGLFAAKPDEEFLMWLKQKPAAWLQQLYAVLHRDTQNLSHQLKTLRIVRLADGELSRADRAFFSTGGTSNDFPVVDLAVYTSGTSKAEKDDAKAFLVDIGVREIGEAEQIEIILKRRYSKEAPIPDDKTYLQDLKRFVAYVEETGDGSIFEDFYIFQGAGGDWHQPDAIYLDQPYRDTGLTVYYEALGNDAQLTALHARYENCGVAVKKLTAFAEEAGATVELEIERDTCGNNPQREYLYSAGGNWTSNGINRDYFVPHLDEMLKTPSLELSRLIWKTLTALPTYSEIWKATYRCNASHASHQAPSRLVHELRKAKWVPQGEGDFVSPADASRNLLPKGFPFDPGYALLKAIQFGETAVRRSAQEQQKDAAAQSLGFADAAEAERARRFSDLPQAEQEKFLADYESRNKPALPDRPLANPERRAQHVREQAMNAPDKQSEIRERSVSIGREDVKAEADTYLREHYRNADGEVTCQICKGPLPFKLDDGREYFEVVEFLPELTKRHAQNYLALCPNHSAMYRFVNGSRETMREAFQALEGNELEVVLADRDLTVYFSKTHIIDLNAVLDAEDSLPTDLDDGEEPLTGTE